jgi:hypothetical protein
MRALRKNLAECQIGSDFKIWDGCFPQLIPRRSSSESLGKAKMTFPQE